VNKGFEPNIVGFACNWCSYAGADLAGTSRIKYPPNIKIIRVMCTGRVTPAFILKSFQNGADGVLVAGCHPGDCHYIAGNLKCEKIMDVVKRLVGILGIGKERLRLEWVSASEGGRFADVVTEFTEQVRELGPLSGKSQG
jgi:F420-non-reducing hydrogenase iron-sulfur subunit